MKSGSTLSLRDALDFGGTLTIEEGSKITGATMTVNGTLKSNNLELSAMESTLPCVLGKTAGITVTGNTTLAAGKKYTFENSGLKSFDNGVQLGDKAELTVKDTNWSGEVYGNGTLVLSGLGHNLQDSGSDGSAGIISGKHIISDSADKKLQALVLEGTDLEVRGGVSGRINNVQQVYVKAGASFGINSGDAVGSAGQELHLAGKGMEGGATAAALYVNTNGNGDKRLNWNIILDADATVYSAASKDATFTSSLTLNGGLTLGGHTLTLIGGGETTLSKLAEGDSGMLKIQDGTLHLGAVAAQLAGVDVSAEGNGTLDIGTTGATVRRLSGSGSVEGSGTLIVKNSDKAAGTLNTFSGTLSEDLELTLQGYLAIAGSLTSELAVNVESGTLDLQGLRRTTKGTLNIELSRSGTLSGATLKYGDVVNLTDNALTLAGTNTLVLTDDLLDAGVEAAILRFTGTPSISLQRGGAIDVDLTAITDTLQERQAVSYRIANGDIRSLEGSLNFGAELAVFNMTVDLGAEEGCITFTPLTVDWDTIYRSTQDNKRGGSSYEWDDRGDVYTSTDPYSAIYIDRSTHIDLSRADMGTHTDGLVLKNPVGTANGDLVVHGKGSGKSMVTLSNNFDEADLEKYRELLPAGVSLENRLTYAGDITLYDTDLQVSHKSADSATRMYGTLTIDGGKLSMQSGKLELMDSTGNDLGEGIRFRGNDGQIILNGATAKVSGRITGAGAHDAEEHILTKNGGTLILDNVQVDGGIIIGDYGTADTPDTSGVVIAKGANELGAGAVLSNVHLHLNAGATLANAVSDTQAFSLTGATELNLTGLSGSGALNLTGANGAGQAITITPAADATYSGNMSGYCGAMLVEHSPYTQTFSGVTGSSNWSLTNRGNIVLNLGAGAANALLIGGLSLEDGSTTAILVNMSRANANTLHVTDTMSVSPTAAVTVAHHDGSIMYTGAPQGSTARIRIGTVDDADKSDELTAARWQVSGIRNLNGAHTEFSYNGITGEWELYVVGTVDNANKYARLVQGGNAVAGSELLWGVTNASAIGGDLLRLDRTIYNLLGNGAPSAYNRAAAGRILAAAAGASTSVLSQALAVDVERQLRTVRNRTTSLGYTEYDTPQSTELPRYTFWINGEYNYTKQKTDNLNPGFRINGWGGTVGASVDADDTSTYGIALTAMYNDLKTNGPDVLDNDMDTYNLSAFARLASGSWMHTLVATVSLAEMKGRRTVDLPDGSYTTRSDTDGMGIGLMYEVGYSIPMNEHGTACIQPIANISWRYAHLRGYSETASTAALTVSSQTYNVVSFGAGLRMQALTGGELFNRSAIFESRAIVKAEAGDKRGESEVALRYGSGSAVRVQSNERKPLGFEFGAGLALPLAPGHELFADGTVDLRSTSTEINATLGYRVSF